MIDGRRRVHIVNAAPADVVILTVDDEVHVLPREGTHTHDAECRCHPWPVQDSQGKTVLLHFPPRRGAAIENSETIEQALGWT